MANPFLNGTLSSANTASQGFSYKNGYQSLASTLLGGASGALGSFENLVKYGALPINK
jgi:hypothetical protein